MPAEVLRLGPFNGGLNQASDPTLVGDNELIDCLNLELDNDGSLVSRPAIQIAFQGATNQRLLIFGGVEFSGTQYLFATRDSKTFVSSNLGSSWTELNPGSASRECKTMEVYNNTVWLPATPGSANGGMSWTPGGGAVAVAALPRAEKCIVHKNRLYTCPGETAPTNASRLSFSAAGDFTTFPGSNFIDVQPGDGDTLNNAVVYQDNLLLFKGESIHLLAYDLDPVDAVLREVNSVVGSHGSFGVVQYENTVYSLYHDKVYEIVNFNFNLINIKVLPVFDNSLPSGTTARYENQHLSLLGERLVFRYYNRTYVFNVRTRTWSEWKKTETGSTIEWHVFGPLVKVHDDPGHDDYYTGYSFDVSSGGYKVIKIHDGRTSAAVEGTGGTHKFFCVATTKDYDFADPIRFKKLFWWGVDIVSGNQIIGSIEPITLLFSITWNDLGVQEWEELDTWGDPLSGVATPFSETIAADSIFNTNKLVKFGKAMRFRKANFSLQLETNGSSTQTTKIFQYVAVVGAKQLVSARTS
jgi:hypothetical protein